MLAKYEKRNELYNDKIWLSRWLNLKNIPHWHDEIEIIYCEKGKCSVNAEGKTIFLSAEETAYIESGKIHHIESAEGTILITIHIDNETIKDIVMNRKPLTEKLTQKYDVSQFYNFIKKELKEKKELYKPVTESAIKLFVAKIFRYEENCPIEENINNFNNKYQLLKDITKEIELNFQYTNLISLSKKFGYSPSHFSKLFSKMTGTTLIKYINTIKIEYAVALIKNQKRHTITEIALLSGFSSIRNFNRIFLSLTGYAPSELPKSYVFSRYSKNYSDNSYNPTNEQSVQID